jgi:U3 small nucleolar RNA-associated protein 14
VDKAKKLALKELSDLKKDGSELPTTGIFGLNFMRNAIKQKQESAKKEAQSVLNELEGLGARLDGDDSDDQGTAGSVRDESTVPSHKRREFSAEELEQASKEIDLMLEREDVTQAQPCRVDGPLTVRGVEAQKLPVSKQPDETRNSVASSNNATPGDVATPPSAPQASFEENPWEMSVPTHNETASTDLIASGSQTAEDAKGTKRKGAAASAEPGGKRKRRKATIEEVEKTAEELPTAVGAELLNVLDADAEAARQQRDLVRATFVEGTQAEDFDEEKDQHLREQEEKDKPEELLGWGSWTGAGVKPRPAAKPKGKPKGSGKGGKQHSTPKPAHVQVSETMTASSQAKYYVDKVPFPFKSPQQYDQEMRMPSGPEWNTLSQHLQRVKPKVFMKVGAIVPPLNYVKHLPPDQQESAINTWAASKQPKRLKARF